MGKVKTLGLLVLLFLALLALLTDCTNLTDVEWHRTYGHLSVQGTVCSVQEISDGGYIIAGSTYGSDGKHGMWLIKVDYDGNEIWDKTFSGSDGAWGTSVQEISDGGYILVGSTDSYGAGKVDVCLVKTDSNGNEIWTKTFGSARYDEGYSVRETSDGGYIIVGLTGSSVIDRDIWLIKTDSNGNEIWNKTFGGSNDDIGYSVQEISDGGYILVGSTESYGAGKVDVWLIKTDTNGNEIWNKTFGGSDDDAGYSLHETSDGSYIIAGYTGRATIVYETYAEGFGDVWLIKTDSNGNEIWNKTFGSAGDRVEVGTWVQETSDRGHILVGWKEVRRDGKTNIWLIKTDPSGNEIWNKTFDRSYKDYGDCVQETSDGGYIIAGSYLGSSHSCDIDVSQKPHIWLIKYAHRN